MRWIILEPLEQYVGEARRSFAGKCFMVKLHTQVPLIPTLLLSALIEFQYCLQFTLNVRDS